MFFLLFCLFSQGSQARTQEGREKIIFLLLHKNGCRWCIRVLQRNRINRLYIGIYEDIYHKWPTWLWGPSSQNPYDLLSVRWRTRKSGAIVQSGFKGPKTRSSNIQEQKKVIIAQEERICSFSAFFLHWDPQKLDNAHPHWWEWSSLLLY